MTKRHSAIWFMWIIASIFYAYQYILRVMPNIMLSDIMQQFNIDAALFGQFSGIYYIGYALMHLPIGIMLDRVGPRKVMSACILMTVIGLFPIILSTNWIYLVIGRALIGIGSSAAILGTFKIIRMSFKESHFTRMLSISVTIGLIGAIYGGGPVSYMCQTLGYQTVVNIFIAMGIMLALVTYLIVPEYQDGKDTAVLTDLYTVFSNKKVIMVCVLAGMMVGPLEGFADVWGTVFLKNVYGFNQATASYIPSMIFIGMCFGSPILSLIAEKSGNYIGAIIGSALIMGAAFVALIMEMYNATTMIAAFILIGICCAYQIIAIYKASTYVPEHVASLTTAAANMIIMSFGYAFHASIGYTVKLFGGTQSISALTYGVGIIPIMLFIASIGYSFVSFKDKHMSLEAAELSS